MQAHDGQGDRRTTVGAARAKRFPRGGLGAVVLLLIAGAGIAAWSAAPPVRGPAVTTSEPVAAQPLVVVLVRHAEKGSDGRDPSLTDAGRARADALVHAVGTAGIRTVHSTPYARTTETAAPIAESLGVPVTNYDPRDLAGFAASLRKTGGRHLVVGHSNTTPALVKLLGGEPGPPIQDAGEYDRLYVVTMPAAAGAKPTTVRLRYGAPSSF